jgi:branched-chain amino acid transport system permease protein
MPYTGGYAASPKLRWTEWLPWVIALAAFFALPEYLTLGARILTFVLLALSLDLIVGYAGFGAYVAGILSAHANVSDPLLQLVAATIGAGALGLFTGAIILRTRGLPLMMLTLAVGSICLEIANKATALTGGADGLSGVTITPVLGQFRFDIFGKTAYLYCLAVLFVGWWIVRRLIHSPFGASLAGIRENNARMLAIGAPVYARLVLVYTISAALAGTAGALLTQTTQFVGLNVLSFDLSGELLVMLILGGVGRLYGAFVGPVVYMIAQDALAKQFPEYWYLGIGLLLVIVVLFARGGVLGLLDRVSVLWKKRP